MKRVRAILTLLAVIAITGVFAAAAAFGGRIRTGTLAFRILDGDTDQPLSGALVVIPEADASVSTDQDGKTERIRVPARRDKRFDTFCRQEFGEATVLVYREGYLPLALFHTTVRAEEDRETVTLWLFPDDGSMEAPFSMIESPDSAWVERLLNRYAPEKN